MSRKKPINVEPLRTSEEISEFIFALKNFNRKKFNNNTNYRLQQAERNKMLFIFGINTGLRISDILKLKVSDVKNKSSFLIYEGKTKKKRNVDIYNIQRDIQKYISDMDIHDYLFLSQRTNKSITTTQAYRILSNAGKFIGRFDIGTHTMRKTFGYHHYKQFKDVAMLQKIFNHSSPSITLEYIGITQDEIQINARSFRLG